VLDYLEKLWLTPNWVRAWTDYGCFELGLDFWLTTNNHIERYWQEIQRLAAGGCILNKRPDEQTGAYAPLAARLKRKNEDPR
jgi:hypothetical protein